MKTFDCFNRHTKRNYALNQQDKLPNLHFEHKGKEFRKKIGKLGRANKKQRQSPPEVVSDDGNVCYDHDDLLSKGKNTYEARFNRSTLTDCTSDFLRVFTSK